MSGMRVNILTGAITRTSDHVNRRYEVRICEYCHHNFEIRKDTKTRFCSISCSKKGQKNRLGAKHSEATKRKMRKSIQERQAQQIEIMPHAKIKNRTRTPHFVSDSHQWANAVYGKYRASGKVPHHKSEEYGLYKYGEWLFNNEKYKSRR